MRSCERATLLSTLVIGAGDHYAYGAKRAWFYLIYLVRSNSVKIAYLASLGYLVLLSVVAFSVVSQQ